jgi:hypothetical protein
MENTSVCQAENTFDVYDDLDLVTNMKIGVTDENCPESVVIEVNGHEIEIDGEAAEKIFQALKYRIEIVLNKKQEKQKKEADEYAAEEAFIEREERRMIDNFGMRKGA